MKFLNKLLVVVLCVILVGCGDSKTVLPDNLTQSIGSKDFGYILVPGDFCRFSDINYPDSTDIQYSDLSAQNIVTMNVVNLGERRDVTLEKIGDLIAGYLSESENLINVSSKTDKINGYDIYQLDCQYKEDVLMIVNLFKDSNGTVHYISVEGSGAFVKEYNNPIISSFRN